MARGSHTVYSASSQRVLRSSATSRRGAAAYGDDNTFLWGAKTLERAPLRVSCLVATTFFTQLFAYVTLVPMPHAASLVLRVSRPSRCRFLRRSPGRTLRQLRQNDGGPTQRCHKWRFSSGGGYVHAAVGALRQNIKCTDRKALHLILAPKGLDRCHRHRRFLLAAPRRRIQISLGKYRRALRARRGARAAAATAPSLA